MKRLMVVCIILAGCTSRSQTTTTTTERETTPVHADAGLDQIIQDVIGASDSNTESAALNRLHDWMTDHQMIYHIIVENAENHNPAPAAAEAHYPLRVTVEMYQGQQLVRSFRFVPRDNRNLTSLGLS